MTNRPMFTIKLTDKTIHCEIPEREVYADPHNRLAKKKETNT